MARWVSEEVVETIQVPVLLELTRRQVTLGAEDLRSPGGTKTMRRLYSYISSPDAAAVSEAFGNKVHDENELERIRVEREFEYANEQQRKIEARRRDAARRARNKAAVGTARRPACSSAIAKSPKTTGARVWPMRVGMQAFAAESHTHAAADVKRLELQWHAV